MAADGGAFGRADRLTPPSRRARSGGAAARYDRCGIPSGTTVLMMLASSAS